VKNKIILFLLLLILAPPAYTQEVVNVYSARHYDTDIALYDRFTELTGIKINLIEGKSDALTDRILKEGEFSPADMLITVDAGRLWKAQNAGVFQPVNSEVLSERVADNLRDPEGHWYGLSKRARVIAFNIKRGLPDGVHDYEDLANESLRGAVCMRSSGNIYNLSLLGSLIENLGEQAAEQWAAEVVKNFARAPQGNDTAQLRAVASGECGVTIANTYYIARLLGSAEEADKKVMQNLGALFPNQKGRGAHVNVSGAGIAKHAPNRDNAIRFLEYLTSDFAQKLFAEGNNEYPIIGAASGPVAKLGKFSEDSVNAATFGGNQARAVKVFDRAGWR